MRSVVHSVDMIDDVLKQQFDLAELIYSRKLMPIVEPEIDIKNPSKQVIEDALFNSLKDHLHKMEG